MAEDTRSDGSGGVEESVAADLLRQTGLDTLLQQLGTLQSSLDQVAGGMEALGSNAVRQGNDVENMASHVLAMEALLTVVLRQVPIDIEDVRAEVRRRSGASGQSGKETDAVVLRLAEDMLRRADD